MCKNPYRAIKAEVLAVFTETPTIKTIRYTKFSYDLGTDKSAKVVVKMSGQASWTLGYKAIALQSDIFTQNKYFIDPIFSNLSPDKKGNILFDLEFSVDPDFVDYNKVIKTENINSPVVSQTGTGVTN